MRLGRSGFGPASELSILSAARSPTSSCPPLVNNTSPSSEREGTSTRTRTGGGPDAVPDRSLRADRNRLRQISPAGGSSPRIGVEARCHPGGALFQKIYGIWRR